MEKQYSAILGSQEPMNIVMEVVETGTALVDLMFSIQIEKISQVVSSQLPCLIDSFVEWHDCGPWSMSVCCHSCEHRTLYSQVSSRVPCQALEMDS